MTDRKRYIIVSPQVRANAMLAVAQAPENWTVTVEPPRRSLDQNAMFHAILTDIARHGFTWAGKRRTVDEIKVLMVSAHAKATAEDGDDVEVVRGLEGELVQLRESTAGMSVRRASSLIEYVLAYCAMNGIPLTETKRQGYEDYLRRIGEARELA